MKTITIPPIASLPTLRAVFPPLSRPLRAAIVLVCIIALLIRLVPGARTIDDAFITFRYSRNLVEGQGFLYNLGAAPTLGTSAPLWGLALAAVSAGTRLLGGTGQDFPRYAIGLSALLDAASCALLFGAARRLLWGIGGGARAREMERPSFSPVIALLPAFLWAISPMSVTFAIGGMETSLVVFWMLLAWWLYLGMAAGGEHAADYDGHRDRRALLLGIVAALSLLTRLDSLLWITPLLLAQAVGAWADARGRIGRVLRACAPTWIACAVLLLPCIAAATAYYGSPIPNSVTAKRFAYLIEPGSALIRLIQAYSTPFFEFDAFGGIGAMVGAFAYLGLSLLAVLTAARRWPRALPILLYPFLYLAVFSLLNPLIFRWYLAPPLPALMLVIVIGASVALLPLLRREDAARTVGGAAFTGLALLWMFTSASGWVLRPDHGPQRPAPRMAWHALELLYEQVGRALVSQDGVTVQTRVASADIGAIGYFSRAFIVDTVGLVTPELTHYYPVERALFASGQNYAIPPALILDTQPVYLVTMEGFVREGLARDPRFTDAYMLERAYPFPFYGSAMQVWRRVGE